MMLSIIAILTPQFAFADDLVSPADSIRPLITDSSEARHDYLEPDDSSTSPRMRPMVVDLEIGNTGEDLYISSRYIGLGVATPDKRLDVLGDSEINGILDMVDNRITNIAYPVDGTDAASKTYVDERVGDGNPVSTSVQFKLYKK